MKNVVMFKFLFAATLILACYGSHAQVTWIGTTSNWNTITNWDCTCTPGSTDDLIFPGGAAAYPSLASGTGNARNITIAPGASVSVTGGTLNIAGSISNSGTFNASSGSGTIILNGSSAQSLPGGAFTGSTIRNLVISNTAGVSITSPLNIAANGTLTVNAGSTLTTNGNLTLLSTGTATTARIANSAGTISGNVTWQRYIGSGRRAYRWLAHPFTTSQPLSVLTDDIDITGTGGSLNGFTTTVTNHPSAMWYDEAVADGDFTADAGWTAFTSTNGAGANAWRKGQGINVLVRGTIGQGLNGAAYTPSAVTLDMTGVVNQGSQVISVTRGPNPTGIYYFVGNPFPSQVDLNLTIRTAGINNFYYIWNSLAGTKGSFEAKFYSNSYILPAGAAFMTGCSANGTITFNESTKSSAVPASILKTTSVTNNLLLRLTGNNDTIQWDKLEVYFDNNAVNDSDAYDAPKFRNPEVNFYTLSNDNKKLDMDSRPYKNGEIIQVYITSAPVGNYAIKTEDFNLIAGTNASLHDKYLNKTVTLSSGYVYQFDVTADPSTQGNRFELLFSGDPVTSVHTVAGSAIEVEVAPNPAHDIVNLNYTLPVSGKAEVRVINMQGAVCRSMQSDLQTTGSLQIAVKDLPAGMYIVELSYAGQKAIQKFIKD